MNGKGVSPILATVLLITLAAGASSIIFSYASTFSQIFPNTQQDLPYGTLFQIDQARLLVRALN